MIPTQNTIDNSILKNILNDFDFNNLDPETLRQDLFGNLASIIGKLDFVRNKLKVLQIKFVDNMTNTKGGCILDGRDIGTEIIPNADFKFYVDAPLEIRAKRRYAQLYLRDKSIKLKTIMFDLEKRDLSDKSRKNSPLTRSNQSILIDTELLNPNQVLKKALCYIKKNK